MLVPNHDHDLSGVLETICSQSSVSVALISLRYLTFHFFSHVDSDSTDFNLHFVLKYTYKD